jgi:hypothetical protein
MGILAPEGDLDSIVKDELSHLKDSRGVFLMKGN